MTFEIEVTKSVVVTVDAPNETLATVAARDAAAEIPLEQWIHLDADVRAFWKSVG